MTGDRYKFFCQRFHMEGPLLVLCMLASCLFASSVLHADWLSRKSEGWAWYEDRMTTELVHKEEHSSPAQQMAAIREELEAKLALAIIDPTEDHVLDYMRNQQRWVNQSAEFSSTWAKLLLSNPGLDATVTGRPTSQYGIQLHKKLKREQRESLIGALTGAYGLFFFYEGDNPASQAFSMVVRDLAQKYSWPLLPVSLDGVVLPTLEETQPDSGAAAMFGVKVLPSLYVVNPDTEEAWPVAYGLASLDQIERNIELQFSNLEVAHD